MSDSREGPADQVPAEGGAELADRRAAPAAGAVVPDAAAAPAGLLLVSLALKSIFGNISGVGVSQVVVSSVLDSSSSPLEVVRSGKKQDISGVYIFDDF